MPTAPKCYHCRRTLSHPFHILRVGKFGGGLITAYVDEKVRAQALKAGVVCHLPKPIDESKLLTCIHSALGDQKTDTTE